MRIGWSSTRVVRVMLAVGVGAMLAACGGAVDPEPAADDGTTTCPDAVVAQEDHVLSVLGDGFRAEVEKDRLTLTSCRPGSRPPVSC